MKFSRILIAAVFAASLAQASTPTPRPPPGDPPPAPKPTTPHYLIIKSMAKPASNLPQAFGDTPAQVSANFYKVVLFNLETVPMVDRVYTSMNSVELSNLAFGYMNSAGWDPSAFWAQTSGRLSATNVARMKVAFSKVIRPVIKGPSLPAPNLDMSLWELYLDFRTSGLTPASAMATALGYFLGGPKLAWNTGQSIGTSFYNMMESINPDYGYLLVTEYGFNNQDAFAAAVDQTVDTGVQTFPLPDPPTITVTVLPDTSTWTDFYNLCVAEGWGCSDGEIGGFKPGMVIP